MATTLKHVSKIKTKVKARKASVSIPAEILDQAIATRSLEPIENYLENWEISHDPKIIKHLEQSEKDIASGNLISLSELKKRLLLPV